MGTVLDLAPAKRRVFKFLHNGEEVAWEYDALSTEALDDIRASMPAPKPPMRRVEGEAKEIIALKRRGIPIEYPDADDPEYQEATRKREDALSLETVRVALGWEMGQEEFARAMRTRLPAGVLANLIRAVDAATFHLNWAEVEQNLDSSSPSMTGGAAS